MVNFLSAADVSEEVVGIVEYGENILGDCILIIGSVVIGVDLNLETVAVMRDIDFKLFNPNLTPNIFDFKVI
jgi:hypothetical protein